MYCYYRSIINPDQKNISIGKAEDQDGLEKDLIPEVLQ